MRNWISILAIGLIATAATADVTVKGTGSDVTVKGAGSDVTVQPAPQTGVVVPTARATTVVPQYQVQQQANALPPGLPTIQWNSLVGSVSKVDQQARTVTMKLNGSDALITVPIDPSTMALYRDGVNRYELKDVA